MTDLPAYAVYRDFPPEAMKKEMAFDRHYLLYASKGTMRLEAEGRTWSLPPARAAWMQAHAPIRVSSQSGITCCSVLFSTDVYAAPADPLTVFDMSALGRALALECRAWGPDTPDLSPYARQLFDTLHATACDLANRPSVAWMPEAQSPALRRAMDVTEARLADEVTFGDIAAFAALSERSLARRFSEELGMTWRQAQRRLRMIRALEMLALDSAQVTEIAMAVGYSSLSAFNSGFRDFTGMTPSAYRASMAPD